MIDDYEKKRKEAQDIITKSAKNSDSKALKNKAKTLNHKEDETVKRNIKVAEMIYSESIEMYREGEFKSFDEFINDLTSALKAVDVKDSKPKPPIK